MKRAYLFVFDPATLLREAIKSWADNSKLVETWRIDLPNTFFLISESNARELDEDFERVVGKAGRYIICETSDEDNRQGRLSGPSWYLLKHKKLPPEGEAWKPSIY